MTTDHLLELEEEYIVSLLFLYLPEVSGPALPADSARFAVGAPNCVQYCFNCSISFLPCYFIRLIPRIPLK
jgi:hypothetical protein